MKFNEKLIELRKKEGLSQEELGYKLNVTRQTVSKWELGQTTPEMDKLLEISKIFNISVDQLINDSDVESTSNVNPIIEDKQINEEGTKNNKVVFILIGILVILAVLVVAKLFAGFSLFNKAANDITQAQAGVLDRFFGIFDKATDIISNQMEQTNQDINNFNQAEMQNTFNNFSNSFEQMAGTILNNNFNSDLNDKINQTQNDVAVKGFNGNIELYAGTSPKLFVVTMLDNVITSNKTNNRKIAIKYNNEAETQDETQIRNIKQKIDKGQVSDKFEVICEYDAQGYIYKVIIEKI